MMVTCHLYLTTILSVITETSVSGVRGREGGGRGWGVGRLPAGGGGGGGVVGCSISLWRSCVCSCCPGRIMAELLMSHCYT